MGEIKLILFFFGWWGDFFLAFLYICNASKDDLHWEIK